MNEEFLTLGSYEKLDPQFKDEFLVALRSGEYEQTQGWLKTVGHEYNGERDEFVQVVKLCCLGVGCDIIDSDAWDEGSRPNWGYVRSRQTDELPWISNKASKRLSDLNDVEKWDFNQIADWVEKYL